MADNRLTILDGGMGRELERMGAPFRQPEWSALALMEAPDTVQAAHENFIKAGAQVVITNAYALVPFHVGQDRFDAEARHLAALAGKLARSAVDHTGDTTRVAGCLPPVFGSYRPDLFDPDQAESLCRPLIEAQAPYVDLWQAETLSCIAEARFSQT